MKTLWRIVGIGVLVAVLASMTVGIVSAKDWPLKGTTDKVDSSDSVKREKDGEKSSERSKGIWGAWSKLLIEVAAEEPGMSTRELWTELRAGATIAGLADAQGVDQQALFDAYIVRLTEWLEQAVEKGAISQADADGTLDKMQSWGVNILSKDWTDASEKNKGKPDGKSAWHEPLIKVASEELGMSTKEPYAELKAGATIADLAEAQGVDQQALFDAYIVRLTEWLEQAVEKGAMSQSDADAMLTKMQSLGVDILNK